MYASVRWEPGQHSRRSCALWRKVGLGGGGDCWQERRGDANRFLGELVAVNQAFHVAEVELARAHAVPAEPLLILNKDDVAVDGRAVAPLVVGRVARVAEDDLVLRRADAALADPAHALLQRLSCPPALEVVVRRLRRRRRHELRGLVHVAARLSLCRFGSVGNGYVGLVLNPGVSITVPRKYGRMQNLTSSSSSSSVLLLFFPLPFPRPLPLVESFPLAEGLGVDFAFSAASLPFAAVELFPTPPFTGPACAATSSAVPFPATPALVPSGTGDSEGIAYFDTRLRTVCGSGGSFVFSDVTMLLRTCSRAASQPCEPACAEAFAVMRFRISSVVAESFGKLEAPPDPLVPARMLDAMLGVDCTEDEGPWFTGGDDPAAGGAAFPELAFT